MVLGLFPHPCWFKKYTVMDDNMPVSTDLMAAVNPSNQKQFTGF